MNVLARLDDNEISRFTALPCAVADQCQHLADLLDKARQNEAKQQRFDGLEQQLVGSQTLAALVTLLLQEYRVSFDLEKVTLALIDPEYECSRYIEADKTIPAEVVDALVLFENADLLSGVFSRGTTPILSQYNHHVHAVLFNQHLPSSSSVAILPLVLRGKLMGSLNLCSSDPGRFAKDSGTHFLNRLGAIASICFENALNHERLKLSGITDPLTSINNRRFYDQRSEEEVANACRNEHDLACMFLDIDKFKRINDSLGHRAGDHVLQSIAQIIKSQMRATDVLARYGGEEFVALLPCTDIHTASEIAERIRASVASRMFQPLPGKNLPVTLSIGITTYRGKKMERNWADIVTQMATIADKALYRAKDGGRNRVVAADFEGNHCSGTQGRHLKVWSSGLARNFFLIGNKFLKLLTFSVDKSVSAHIKPKKYKVNSPLSKH